MASFENIIIAWLPITKEDNTAFHFQGYMVAEPPRMHDKLVNSNIVQ